jgi:membrane protein DedA with SNARE-associated domain
VSEAVSLLLRHGYLFLFAIVFVEQAGLPVPAVPVLLAMGALAGAGRFSFSAALAVAVAACLLADTAWFYLGRRYGSSILRVLCRISLEPDSCVSRSEGAFAREGGRPLLYAKFVPGLSTVAPPVAGLAQLSLARFLAWDTAGSVYWSASFLGLGYVFSHQLEKVAEAARALGFRLGLAVVGGFALYLIWKLDQRRRVLRQLDVARIDPEELRDLLQSGPGRVVVVDLRNALERGREPATVPGAIVLAPGELDVRHREIPRDRDVVLFCT